jgi:hypothetical protein
MRRVFSGVLAFTFLAALTLANTANAGPILSFSNVVSTDPVVGTVVAGGTNLTTPGNVANPGSTQVMITSINGSSVVGLPPAFLTLVGVRGTGAASTSGAVVSQDTYSGTVIISSAPGGAGTNILTTTFTGGNLSFTNSTSGGGPSSGALSASNVTFTSANAGIIAILGGASVTGGSFSISLQSATNVTTTGSPFTIAGFSAVPQGGFIVSAVPEPASIAMASTAVLAGLGCFGFRRFKSTRV